MKARCLVVPLLLAGLAAAVRAQEPAVDLTATRAKTELTDEDRGLIRTFVNQRVGLVAGADAAPARRAGDELRSAFDGSDAFKREYATACLETIAANYKKADLIPATRLLVVVDTFNLVEAHNLLLDALGDERVGVRAAAAAGLRNLRAKLVAAGRDVFLKVLDGLKEAGKREKSRDTLKTIYAAMNYFELPSAPDTKANVGALLELLEARARQYAAGKPAAIGADDTGLRLAQVALKSMDDAERQRLTVAVATMTRSAIERYTSPATSLWEVPDKDPSRELVELRNALERLVLVGEELLVTLVKPDKPPAVGENMRKLNIDEMKDEWQKKWVPLLQKAVNQDFTLKEPAEEGAAGEGG
jgi:hypothetical protein